MTTCQCDGCGLLRAERDDLARSALEEHQALVAERERCAEYAAEISVYACRTARLRAERDEALAFLQRTATTGGSIVSSAAMTAQQIAIARAAGRMLVTPDGYGFVYVPGPRSCVCGRVESGCDPSRDGCARCAEYAAEAARLRKLFDDAGQGEHNVLALVEHYQRASMEADERLRAVRKLLEEHGCDCQCDHHADERGPDCEVCLACRIEKVLCGGAR